MCKIAGTEKDSLTKSKILCANVTGNPRFAEGEPTELCSARRGFSESFSVPVTLGAHKIFDFVSAKLSGTESHSGVHKFCSVKYLC